MKNIVVLTGAGISAESGRKHGCAIHSLCSNFIMSDENPLWLRHLMKGTKHPQDCNRTIMFKLLLRTSATCTNGPAQKTYCICMGSLPTLNQMLKVYPAAGLTQYVRTEALKYMINVKIPYLGNAYFRKIVHPATIGVPIMVEELLAEI